MPFTPFHFGPGAAIKAVIPRYFSFSVFCFTQVVTDCEVAYYLYRGEYPVHRWLHTLVGATVVAIISAIVGRYVCQWALRWWCSRPHAPFKRFVPDGGRITFVSALSGAFLGTYSHILLDAIMHRDVGPFMPWTSWNPAYGTLDLLMLHAGCFVLGILGAWFYFSRCEVKKGENGFERN